MNWHADIDATIAFWQCHGVDSSDAYWALGYRKVCWGGWALVRYHMLHVAARWEKGT